MKTKFNILLILILISFYSCSPKMENSMESIEIDTSYGYGDEQSEVIQDSLFFDTTAYPAPYTSEFDNVGGTGVINYALNDTMIVGVTNEVNVTISRESDKRILLQDIPEFNENNLVTDSIRIASVMKARLVDPTGVNFRIISRTSEEQFIENDDYTRWIWDVTPLKEGDNELSLTVDIVVNDKSKSINVYDGEIYVYSDETFFQKVITFLSKNWQYLLSTILIPVFVFLYKKYKKPKL